MRSASVTISREVEMVEVDGAFLGASVSLVLWLCGSLVL